MSSFDLSGTAYPLVSLAKALGLAHGGENLAAARVLIVGNADRKIALVVDELLGQQEVVVKRLGRHLQSVAGVAGATILGNGQVVLILNVMDLLGTPGRRALRPANIAVLPRADQAPVAAAGALAAAAVAPVPPDAVLPTSAGDNARLAMVVDDSLERTPGVDTDPGTGRLAGARGERWRRGAGNAGLGAPARDAA